MQDIIVIADTQIAKGNPIDHIHSLLEYIWIHKPKYIVHIGDHWDFPSLSHYMTALEKEGRRLIDDLDAGFNVLDIVKRYLKKKNSGRKVKYTPELHFCMGNHENRLERYINNNPELSGFIDLKYNIESYGWKVHDFLVPLWINEICFVHYLANSMSNRAVGGSIENKLNKYPHSFAHGHQQQ